MIYDRYKIRENHGALSELQGLLAVSLKNEDLRAFLNDWDQALAGMSPAPKDDVTETLLRVHVGKFVSPRDISRYRNLLNIGHEGENYTQPHLGKKVLRTATAKSDPPGDPVTSDRSGWQPDGRHRRTRMMMRWKREAGDFF